MAKSKKKAAPRGRKTAAGKKKKAGKARAARPARPAAKASARKAPAKKAAPRRPGVRQALRPKKTRLSRKELAAFREMLLEKRRTLVGDLSGMEQETSRQGNSGNLSSMPTHMADVGTDNFEHEFTLGLLESEQAMLREINEALQRVQERTYGVCLGTGKNIPKARLRAKPWAKYTVDYTRMLEKGLVRPPEVDTPPSEDEEQG